MLTIRLGFQTGGGPLSGSGQLQGNGQLQPQQGGQLQPQQGGQPQPNGQGGQGRQGTGPTGNLNSLLGGIALGGPNGAINQNGGIGALLSGASGTDPNRLNLPGGTTTTGAQGQNIGPVGQPGAGLSLSMGSAGQTLAQAAPASGLSAAGMPLDPSGSTRNGGLGGGASTLQSDINQALANAQVSGLSTSL
jgi:hypothetical protein